MRSLVTKLTLAFLLIGLTGAVLVAVIVHRNTQTAFDLYLVDQARQVLVSDLESYYQANGSWAGVENILRGRSKDPAYGHLTLVDADRRVVYGRGPSGPDDHEDDLKLENGIPLAVDGVPIGWLLIEGPDPRVPAGAERAFLDRVNQATVLSALIAAGLAILLGGLLAFGLTRSLRELTQATEELAQGRLGLQVRARSRDELGKLADAFNKMSGDLAKATQARRQMTADIAHELRSPLSVISGYAEALDDGKLPGTPEVYQILHQEALHLSRLVDDLRLLSLADAGELNLNLAPVDPGALVERAAARHAMAAQQREISLVAEAAPDLPETRVDGERMAQVLDNLVLNAFRYTPAGGWIELRAGPAQGGVQIEVQDSGRGIDPEDLPHIFDRFYRGDRARAQNGESGLGLAIARSLIEAQGGWISVDSRPGEGARFILWLPGPR